MANFNHNIGAVNLDTASTLLLKRLNVQDLVFFSLIKEENV